MQKAFTDRRMLKFELSNRPGGLVEAHERYSAEASPSLLILEIGSDVDALLPQLETLAEVCVAGTNLILVGSYNDVALYRSLIRSGIADYLVLPIEPVRLVEAVLDLYNEPGKQGSGQIIAFTGAKGGCGSSTLACNAAWRIAAETDADVVLLDLDLPFGSADLALNIETSHGVHSVLSDPERIDDSFLHRFAAKYGERLHLLAAPSSLEFDSAVPGPALEATLDALRRQAKFIVLDLPRVWSEWTRHLVHTADQVVLTAMPDLVSVRNARNLVDFLATRRSLDQPPVLVVNRVGAAKRGEVVLKDFSTTVGLAPAVVIAEDGPTFGQAAAVGKMLDEVNRRSKAAEAIRQLAVRLSGPPPAKARPANAGAAAALMKLLTGKK
ncbi:MAG: AAA family ATPase [Rhodospirillaceae bacterium]